MINDSLKWWHFILIGHAASTSAAVNCFWGEKLICKYKTVMHLLKQLLLFIHSSSLLCGECGLPSSGVGHDNTPITLS